MLSDIHSGFARSKYAYVGNRCLYEHALYIMNIYGHYSFPRCKMITLGTALAWKAEGGWPTCVHMEKHIQILFTDDNA